MPGLRLLAAILAFDTADRADRLPRSLRLQMDVVGRIPGLRRAGHLARFAFGPP